METNASNDDSVTIDDGQASASTALELNGHPQVTHVDAATAGSSAARSGIVEIAPSVPSAKRTADTAADGEAAEGGQQPDEPAAKRARSGDHADQDRSVECLHVTVPAANDEQQQPHASVLDTAAPAASPSKGRISPLPSVCSPSVRRQGDVVLRLLVLDRSVATIIGKGGSTVKAIQSSTGARIQVMPPVPGVEERVVIVSIPEDPEQAVSGAERALHAIQRQLIVHAEPTAAAGLQQLQQELAPEPITAGSSGAEGTEAEAESIGAAAISPAAQATAVSAPTAGSRGEQQQEQQKPQPNQLSEHAAGTESNGGASTRKSPAVEASKNMPVAGVAAAQTITAAATGEHPSSAGQSEPQEAAAQPGAAAQLADAAAVCQQEQVDPVTVLEPPQQPDAAKVAPPEQEQPTPPAAAIPALGGDAPAAPRARSMQHTARLLVSPSQASSLLTAGAAGLRSVKEQSSAFVKVLQADESPYCCLEGDRITQVIGTAQQVFKAAILLGAHLRKHPATELPGGLHAGLAARGGRRHGSRGGYQRSPPPPPPPRGAYAGQYGTHAAFGGPPHGYGGCIAALMSWQQLLLDAPLPFIVVSVAYGSNYCHSLWHCALLRTL